MISIYILIVAFYFSLICMACMLFLKRREVATGNISIISRFGRGTDHIFSTIFSFLRRIISYINKHTFIALAQWLAFHVLVHVRRVYVEIKHRTLMNVHTRKVIDMVRGRGEVKKHGASFFLRLIEKDEPRGKK